MSGFLEDVKMDSLRYPVLYFFLIVSFFVFLCSGFISCSDSAEADLDSREGSGLSEEEEEDFARCRGEDVCEDVCKTIYHESWKACSRAGSETVGNIQRIYSRLKTTRMKRARLNEISNERDGMTIDHFKEYLDIGVDGWIKQIEGYATKEGPDAGPSYDLSQAQDVISWLAEEEEIAEVLLDVEDGSKVLEALMIKANDGVALDCFWKGTSQVIATLAGPPNIEFKEESSYGIVIENSAHPNDSIKIKINGSKYQDLYELLSCTHVDSSGKDIFSVAAYEDNEALFNVAFNLLDKVCKDSVLSGHDKEEDICRRAMMCVLAIYYMNFGAAESNDADVATWDGWDYATDRFDINGFDEDEACGINDDHTEFGGNIEI